MYPDYTGEVAGCKQEVCPVFCAFGVSFVGCGTTEREGQSDYETHHCEKDRVDTQSVNIFGNDCDGSGPAADEEKRENELGQDAAVQTEKVGPFAVMAYVARTGEVVVQIEGFVGRCSEGNRFEVCCSPWGHWAALMPWSRYR